MVEILLVDYGIFIVYLSTFWRLPLEITAA